MRELRLLSQAASFLNHSISMGSYHEKKRKIAALEQLHTHSETVILYESPFRLKDTFSAIQTVYGEQQSVVLCRELTKTYEEFIRGTAAELVALVREEELKANVAS